MTTVINSICDFSTPNAEEHLKRLSDIQPAVLFLKDEFSFKTSALMNAFHRMDIKSLEFILNNQIISPTMLCYILRGLFYLLPNNVNLTEHLLNYLIQEHPITISNFNPEYIRNDILIGGDLLYAARNEKWQRQLIQVGCNPFEQFRNNSVLLPGSLKDKYCLFFRMIYANKYDFVEWVVQKYPDYNYAKLLNGDTQQYSVLHKYLYNNATTKNDETLKIITNMITMLIKLGADLDYRGDASMNATDYLEYYGYKQLLIQELGYGGYLELKLPEPTGATPTLDVFTGKTDYNYVNLFSKYRYAKSQAEFGQLLAEYKELELIEGPFNEKQLTYEMYTDKINDYVHIVYGLEQLNMQDVIHDIKIWRPELFPKDPDSIIGM